jgi:hypothetical protein
MERRKVPRKNGLLSVLGKGPLDRLNRLIEVLPANFSRMPK